MAVTHAVMSGGEQGVWGHEESREGKGRKGDCEACPAWEGRGVEPSSGGGGMKQDESGGGKEYRPIAGRGSSARTHRRCGGRRGECTSALRGIQLDGTERRWNEIARVGVCGGGGGAVMRGGGVRGGGGGGRASQGGRGGQQSFVCWGALIGGLAAGVLSTTGFRSSCGRRARPRRRRRLPGTPEGLRQCRPARTCRPPPCAQSGRWRGL